MEEENKGKEPIVLEEMEGKRPLIINNEEEVTKIKNSGFKKQSKVPGVIFIIILLVIIMTVIFNNFSFMNLEKIKDSVVMIKVYDMYNNEISTGSGFCAYNKDYIITNFHVIEGAYKIKIITDDNEIFTVKDVMIFNMEEDLAILTGDFDLEPLKIGDTNNIQVGKEITAIGSPMGQLNTVSTGIVSNADNDYEIRITAPISPGSSGGVLLDQKGNVIGVTYATYNSLKSQNINYAISVEFVEKMYKSLLKEDYKYVSNSSKKEYLCNITNSKSFADMIINGTYESNYYNPKNYDEPDELLKYCQENKYISTESMYVFYQLTSKLEIFNNAIDKYADDNNKYLYNLMNYEQKWNVIDSYENLLTYDSYSKELSPDISSWSIEQYILELNLMQAYELAIFIEFVDQCDTTEEIIDYLNDSSLEYEERIIVLKLLDAEENNYNNDIVDYFNNNEDITYEQEIELLEYLGMQVDYDGTVSW